jgi:hypothetical protein
MNGEAFSNELIGIDPQELHVQKEQRHKKSDDERPQERAKKKPCGALQSSFDVDNPSEMRWFPPTAYKID